MLLDHNTICSLYAEYSIPLPPLLCKLDLDYAMLNTWLCIMYSEYIYYSGVALLSHCLKYVCCVLFQCVAAPCKQAKHSSSYLPCVGSS